jgi:hypothetical protein
MREMSRSGHPLTLSKQSGAARPRSHPPAAIAPGSIGVPHMAPYGVSKFALFAVSQNGAGAGCAVAAQEDRS